MRSRNSGSAKEIKKRTWTLIKWIGYSVLLVLPWWCSSQTLDGKERVWKHEKDYLEYRKARSYNGPEEWYGSGPAPMSEDDFDEQDNPVYQGIDYDEEQIFRDRGERFEEDDNGRGDVPDDPSVQRPDPVELPKFDPPDIDGPDVDPPRFSADFWKVFFFILIAVVAMVIVYLIVKNSTFRGLDKKILVDVENDWNPEVISKTELESRLEEAMRKHDYRESIRIYFTFILKELIKKSWISWKKEKTNHRYVQEMASRPNAHVFSECVRIYDIVWYGNYTIDEDIFELLRPTLEGYYKSLNPAGE